MAPPDLQQTIERLSKTLEKSGRAVSRRAARADTHQDRMDARRERRAQRREEARENASIPAGVFALVVALAMVGFAVTHLNFWWLLFVALGIGTGGARQVSMGLDRERARHGPLLRQDPARPQRHEIDALCDQLLADLKASPEVVRAFLQQPEETVEALRLTAKAVDQRRKDLAIEGSKEQLEGLEKQRADLRSRRDGSSDAQARTRFDGALSSLDGQEAALRQLSTVSERLDGEYTSLLVLLQEMKTRVAVARSTNTGAQLAGLEQNVQRLKTELEAITDSLVMAPIDASVGLPAEEFRAGPDRVRDA